MLRLLLFVIFILIKSQILWSQNPLFFDTLKLSEIVVRGTLIKDSLLKIPASVSIINTPQLNQNNGVILTPALNQIPGVYMQQGALNTNRIVIRGIGARSQYSTNRIKTYLNGIPITTAEGETTLEDIDPNILQRIEIIKGPNSSVYGAGLGGVINLYTVDTIDSHLNFKSILGSFGLLKYSASAGLDIKNASLTFSYNDVTTAGYRDNSQYDRKNFTLNSKITVSDKSRLAILANLTQLKAFIPSSLNESDLYTEPTKAAFIWQQSMGYESYDKLLLGLSHEYRFNQKFTNNTTIFTHFRDAYEPRPFNILEEERTGVGLRSKFNLSYSLFNKSAQLAFGTEYLKEYYESRTLENLYKSFPNMGSIAGSDLSHQQQERDNLNIFAQQNLQISSKLLLEAGLNFNHTQYELNDLYHSDSLDQSGDYRFKGIWSPRLGLSYKLTPQKVIYSSISQGFSTPSVAETLTPEGLINTDLKPEIGINYELGLKANWLGEKLYTEIAIYTIKVENLLVAKRIDQDQYVGINAGKTDHTGLEMLLDYDVTFLANWAAKIFTNASFNFFTFNTFIDDGNNYSGNNLPGVPKQQISTGLIIDYKSKFRFWSNYLYVGKVPVNDLNTAYTAEYALTNFKASYNIAFLNNFNVQLHAGINNVFNKNYAASIVPNAVGFNNSAPRYFYPGDARNYYAGVSLSVNFK